MPRELDATAPTSSIKRDDQENRNPNTGKEREAGHEMAGEADEDLVLVSREDGPEKMQERDQDTEMADASRADNFLSSSPDGARLHRMSAHPFHHGAEDDDDDSAPLHPLMSRLQNRLLSRNTNNNRGGSNKFDSLHPYTSILSLADVEQCVSIESEAFPENERCSREKFVYRLTQCPELSLGIFSRPIPSEAAKSGTNGVPRLLAHVIATRTPAPSVSDATMALPPDWQNARRSSLPKPGEGEPLGHQNEGRTICVHSLAVVKEHQNKGLGSILMKAYIQRIRDSKTADRIALLAHDHLIKFYSGMGFENMGDSSCQFGGGDWNNMILEFGEHEE